VAVSVSLKMTDIALFAALKPIMTNVFVINVFHYLTEKNTMNKQMILEKSIKFPHVFRLLPIVAGKPTDPGTWAAYQHDEVTIFWINTSHIEAQKYYNQQLRFKEESSMAKALTVQEDKQVKSLIASNIQAIKSVLPKHATPERIARIAYTALITNPTLARCTQLSLMNCIIQSSILGLEIGGPLGHAVLIPFKNNRIGQYEATLVIQYQGLIALAHNTGNVKSVTAHPVFENDQFRYNYGLNPDLAHVPCREVNPGELIHAYAIIQYTNGGHDFEVIGAKVASEAMGRSAAKFQKDSPWNKKEDIPAMWVKTAIRRLMNRVPKSAEIRKSMDVETVSGQDMNHIIDIKMDDFPPINMGATQISPTTSAQKTGDKQSPEQSQEQNTQQQGTKQQNSDPEPNSGGNQTQQSPEQGKADEIPENLSKEVMQVVTICETFPDEYKEACGKLGFGEVKPHVLKTEDAVKVYKKVNELLDSVDA